MWSSWGKGFLSFREKSLNSKFDYFYPVKVAEMKRALGFLLAVLALTGQLYGQEKKDTVPTREKHFKNTLKINPTPALIWNRIYNLTLAYERQVSKNQTFAIQLGYLGMDPFLEDSIGNLLDINRKSEFGVNAAFDYRFYAMKRNPYPAPNGLYFGPYLSYYGYKYVNAFHYNHADTAITSGTFSSAYNMVNLGVELGYQFIFWNRLSIDFLLFGPSLSLLVSNWKVQGEMPQDDQQKLLDQIRQKFNDSHPVLSPFVEPNAGKTTLDLRLFLRYSVSIGFHF